ncbi:hypothetical protein [Synechococcus sp. PCC 7502]|uniref:hypothetical protein n=1 Tax=Synechococcus sp. PCC 7502 TaxID=1173263 RepID=UPI0002E0CC68|nr:hypothetical protein [Synechococcus sp. PCC 7502]
MTVTIYKAPQLHKREKFRQNGFQGVSQGYISGRSLMIKILHLWHGRSGLLWVCICKVLQA